MSDSEHGVPSEYVQNFFGACHGGELLEYFPECGATWWRNGTNWTSQEPEPGEFNFDELDSIARDATNHDVKLMPILGFTAPWASSAPDDATQKNRYPPREDAIEDWKAYIETLVDRYPEVDYYEIWNEPNIDSFFRSNYQMYVDRILIPAAKALHAHGKKVVAPSFTLEHPDRPVTHEEFEKRKHWNNQANIESMNRWLQYHDAWEHIDYLSIHYSKGDTEKERLEFADNMMAFYDYIYENFIEPGKIDGIWDTEEGLTATQAAKGEFVALEPWEREPFAQWVSRYTIPVLHWALDHEWDERDDYKVFWYHMDHEPDKYGTLQATNLLEETDDGAIQLSPLGNALRTLTRTLTDCETVNTYRSNVEVGFGIFTAEEYSAYEFTNYAFELDDRVFVAAWLDLPGIELTKSERTKIQATVEGLTPNTDVDISVIDYVTGEEELIDDYEWTTDGQLQVRLPRIDDPVLYFSVTPR